MTDVDIIIGEQLCQYQGCDRLADRCVEFSIKGLPHHATLCPEHADEFEGIDLLEFHGKYPAQKSHLPVI